MAIKLTRGEEGSPAGTDSGPTRLEALKKSEEKFAKAFRASPNGLSITNLRDGTVVEVNEGFGRITGFRPEEMVGRRTVDLGIWPRSEDRERVARKLARDGRLRDERITLRHRSEGDRPCVVSAEVIDIDGERCALAVTRDVTELQRNLQQLDYHMRFEHLIAEISSRFIGLKPDEVDDYLERALQELGRFAGADSAYLFRFSDDGQRISMSHLWRTERNRTDMQRLQDLDLQVIPGWTDRLKANEPVAIEAVSELGPRLRSVKGRLRRQNIGAVVDVPMMYEGRPIGFLGLSSSESARRWTQQEIALLRLAGQIVANAIMRTQFTRALREGEARLQSILDNSPAVIYVKDFDGRFLMVNERFAREAGVDRSQILGKTDHDLFPSELAEVYAVNDRKVIESGRATEFEETPPGAEPRVFLSSKFPLYDTQGRMYAIGGISSDITSRKQAETAAREKEQLLESIIDNSPALVYLKDVRDRYQLVNRHMADMFGRTRAEMVGRTSAELLPADLARACVDNDQHVLAQRRPMQFAESASGPDGTQTFLSIKFPMADADGRIVGLGGISTDITARQILNDALRKLVDASNTSSGTDYFQEIVRGLAELLGVRCALVAETLPEDPPSVRTLAALVDGKPEAFRYELSGTPCEHVLAGELCYYESGVADLFPEDAVLTEMGIESYMGTSLRAPDGSASGLLVLMDSRPLRYPDVARDVLKVYATRAGAELARQRAEDAVQRRDRILQAVRFAAARFLESASWEDQIDDVLRELGNAAEVSRVYIFQHVPDEHTSYRSSIAHEWTAPGIVATLDDPRLQRMTLSDLGMQSLEPRLSSGDVVYGRRSEQPATFRQLLTSQGVQSFVLAPVLTAGDWWGTIGWDECRYERAWTRSEIDALRAAADTLAAAISNSRAFAEISELRQRVEQENEYLREQYIEQQAFGDIVGRSSPMQKLYHQIDLVAPTESTVLIQGASGTGKEVIARAIHSRSRRSGHPLIKVNCASVPRELFESEFFGHVRGSFTGAIKDRAGRFELADGGTLFLDEVGEIPLELQGKLLHVLQEGEFERVGEERTRRVDVRVIAATNRDLEQDVRSGRFRRDLYFRLSVFPIQVVPLAERRDDIPLLAEHFLELSSRRLGVPLSRLRQRHVAQMQAYDWPGNIRELQNVIERAVIRAQDGFIELDLPTTESRVPDGPAPPVPEPRRVRSEREMRKAERENLVAALEETGWKVYGPGGAAELLGLKPSTLTSRMRAFGLRRRPSGPPGAGGASGNGDDARA